MSNLEFEKEKEQQQTAQYGDRLEFEDKDDKEVEPPEIDDNDDDIEIPEEDQQLALFDIPEEKKTKKKTSSPKKAAPQDKVGANFTVMYAGHQIAVPKDDMTLEEVRSFLEGDFPELSKERAELLLDKEKLHVVPVVKGAKKG